MSGWSDRMTRARDGLRWYLREVTGESAYESYVAHARRDHPGADVATRYAFERARQDVKEHQPQQRCC